ncbi:MAG: histidine triad nucleotide-binding protein [Myxococcota bacterium]
MSKTIFTKIIDGELPAERVYEDDSVVAIRDINPVAPTHVLIVPRKPIDRIEHVTEEDEALLGHMMVVATKIARQEGLNQGYRLVLNNGEHGRQSVFHIHLHLLGGRELDVSMG